VLNWELPNIQHKRKLKISESMSLPVVCQRHNIKIDIGRYIVRKKGRRIWKSISAINIWFCTRIIYVQTLVNSNSLASPEDSRIWKETRFQIGSLWNSQECCAISTGK
jgi:hypothetical protein